MRIIIADSGSTDGTVNVARRYPVLFLPGPNRGFAAGQNRVLAHPDANARYVLFVNPDTQLHAGTLKELLALADARPQCGVFTVKQIDEHGVPLLNVAVFPSVRGYWRDALPWAPLLYKRDKREYLARSRQEHEFDWASGSFLLVRKTALDSAGGFDERFFMYSEEVDLCRRIKTAGWRAVYLPQLTVIHRIGSRSADPPLVIHSAVIYANKWFPFYARLLIRIAIAVRFARAAINPRRTREERRNARARIRTSLGTIDQNRMTGRRPQ